MNAVERGKINRLFSAPRTKLSHNDSPPVAHYTRSVGGVPQEAAYEKQDVKPPSEWPSQGAVEFKDVRMSYRPGLPEVLKGITMSVRGGEKIGVVGRYAVSLTLRNRAVS